MSQETVIPKDAGFLGEIRLGRHLDGLGPVSSSSLVLGAGLILVLSVPLAALPGWGALVAVLVALLAVGLTLWSALELLAGGEEEGGTHVLVHQTLGGLAALLTGWCMLGATLVLAAVLARVGAQQILPSVGGELAWDRVVGALCVGLLVAGQLFQARFHRPSLWPGPLVLVGSLLIPVLLSLLRRLSGSSLASVETALSPLLRSAAVSCLTYCAVEVILNSRQQVRYVRRDVPRATVAVLGAIGLVAGFVSWSLRSLGIAPVFTDLAPALVRATGVPRWLTASMCVLALLWAADECIRMAATQLYMLSRMGDLPAGLQRLRSPLTAPPLISLFVLAVTLASMVLLPPDLLLELGAGQILVVMALLNLAAIYSRRSQPERRRWTSTPFAPLVPGLALTLIVVLFRTLSAAGMVGTALCLLVGLVVYVAYSRPHQVEARAGSCVFGPERPPRTGDVYRILVPMQHQDERRLALNAAIALACRLQGEVIPLQVVPTPDPLAIAESQRLAEQRNDRFAWSVRLGTQAGVPVYPITRLAHGVVEGILNTAAEEACQLILMPWAETRRTRRRQLGSVLDPVVREAPCDVAVIALSAEDQADGEFPEFLPRSCGLTSANQGPDTESRRITRVMVAAGEGPHAPTAMRLGMLLASEYGASVTAVRVLPSDVSEQDRAAGLDRLRQLGEPSEGDKGLLGSVSVEPRILEGEDVAALLTTASTGHSLVLMGASREGWLDQFVFGSVPEQVARACSVPVVVVRTYRGLPRLWVRRLASAIYQALPKLSNREQLLVYRDLRRGARPDVDFFMMMALAATMATFGLLQNSSAVIIGAMLVAPLFTPILSVSIAVVRGDARLLALATESAVKGAVVAVSMGAVLAWLSPLLNLTPEIAGRTVPNLFDLGVALASGLAGAYATCRKDVAAALPGVGIAAALVPPLCTAGIGLAMGNVSVALGASLLFAANFVAIVLAGAIMLLLLGFRPVGREEAQASIRRSFVILLALLVLIAVPLGLVFAGSIRQSRAQGLVEQYLAEEMGSTPNLELVQVRVEEVGADLEITALVYAADAVEPDEIRRYCSELSLMLSRPVRLRLATIDFVDSQAASTRAE